MKGGTLMQLNDDEVAALRRLLEVTGRKAKRSGWWEDIVRPLTGLMGRIGARP